MGNSLTYSAYTIQEFEWLIITLEYVVIDYIAHGSHQMSTAHTGIVNLEARLMLSIFAMKYFDIKYKITLYFVSYVKTIPVNILNKTTQYQVSKVHRMMLDNGRMYHGHLVCNTVRAQIYSIECVSKTQCILGVIDIIIYGHQIGSINP